MNRALAAFAILFTTLGCDSTDPDDAACAAVTRALPADAHHTATCADACGNGLNPPTGGPHCGSSVACRVHQEEQPLCAWLHNLEHGHAVLLYNCPSGCPEVVDALARLRDGAGDGKRRIALMPWSGLERRAGAVVWGASWSGDEVDEAAIRCVLDRQDLDAPEPGLGCAQ